MENKYQSHSIDHLYNRKFATAIASFIKAKAITKTIVRKHGKKALVGGILFSFLFVSIIVGETVSAYLHYASIVDTQLSNQFFHQPPGIFAAPRRVGVGQRITKENLVQDLLRAGYVNGPALGDFAVGNFLVQGDSVKLYTADFARNESSAAMIQVNFKKNEVAEVVETETGRKIDHIFIPAELLTVDFNSKGQTRRATSFDEIPAIVINAICAIEDRHFFTHSGVDISGIVRAALKNAQQNDIREGASTITQQLVKNEFLTPEKTYRRKLIEAMMAVALERRLTKQQIMTLYVDRVYLGHSGLTSVYGFRQGAQVFFGKELRDLNVSEAAFLAGIVKAPNLYSPHTHLSEALLRRNIVLKAMADAGYISNDLASQYQLEQVTLLPPQKLDDSTAPYFIDYVKREIAKLKIDDNEQSKLRVETTIDLDLQQAANQVLLQHMGRISALIAKRNHNGEKQPETALVALDPQSGAILAMVGGRDYRKSPLNRASDAMRQPGSVFKPIVYATALSHGISPASTYVNSPREIEYGFNAVYRPQNYGRSYSNQSVTMRESLVRSLNVVTVDVAMQAGLGNVANMAERMGMPKPQIFPSMALGAFEATPLDVARAYTTFANNGSRVDPMAIKTVKQNGYETFNGEPTKSSVLSPSISYLVTDALADVVNRGTGARIRQMGYRGPAAGKTGTSRDAWFVGYTPKLLVVVWVGFDDNTDLNLLGGEAAVPIWADFVKRALEIRPDLVTKEFPRPSGMEIIEIDPDTGAIANEFCPHRQRMLMANFLSPGICFEHQAPLDVSATEFSDLTTPVDDNSTPTYSSTAAILDEEPARPPILEGKEQEDKTAKRLVIPSKYVFPH